MNRMIVLSEENTCWICKEPARENDPLTADHVLEVGAGGTSDRDNLRAAHLSCNGKRGVAFREGEA